MVCKHTTDVLLSLSEEAKIDNDGKKHGNSVASRACSALRSRGSQGWGMKMGLEAQLEPCHGALHFLCWFCTPHQTCLLSLLFAHAHACQHTK